MDTEFEREDFEQVTSLEELEALEGADAIETADTASEAPQADEQDMLERDTQPVSEQDGGYGTYGAVIRQRPLLNADQEKSLGERLLKARLEMTEALSVVPSASAHLVRSWDEALAGDRPISEVLQWPLGEPRKQDDSAPDSDTSDLSPRERLKLMGERYERWRAGRAKRGATGPGRCPPPLRALFNESAPAFAMLCELRAEAGELVRELDAVKGRSAAAKRRRAELEERAGTDAATLRKAVTRAGTAERRSTIWSRKVPLACCGPLRNSSTAAATSSPPTRAPGSGRP